MYMCTKYLSPVFHSSVTLVRIIIVVQATGTSLLVCSLFFFFILLQQIKRNLFPSAYTSTLLTSCCHHPGSKYQP
jgi:hypothetical protein